MVRAISIVAVIGFAAGNKPNLNSQTYTAAPRDAGK